MSFFASKTRKIHTYGRTQFKVLAKTDDPASEEDEEAGPSSGSGRASEPSSNTSNAASASVARRATAPAASRQLAPPTAHAPSRPALVSQRSSNSELQDGSRHGGSKGKGKAKAADEDFVAPKLAASSSRQLVPLATQLSIAPTVPPSPAIAKRLRSAKPPATVVSDLSIAEHVSEADSEPTDNEEDVTLPLTRARGLSQSRRAVSGPFAASSSKTLLEACKQSSPIPFADVMVDIGQRLQLPGSDRVRPRWTKMAEASYSEVFAVSASPQKVPKMEDVVVVKIIPIKNGAGRRASGAGELPADTPVEDVERELRITKMLAGEGFVSSRGAFVVQGAYPSKILTSWDNYAETRQSQNIRPDAFAASQQYLLLCLPHCGVELEMCKLSSWVEAASIIWQVSLSLAKAERSYRFEHRDLHWGNVLVQRVPPSAAAVALAKSLGAPAAALSLAGPADWPTRLSAARSGVQATIIDYTLSRADGPAGEALFDAFDDEMLFEGEGDEQFEVYRTMRTLTKGKWAEYHPATNLMWLLYLINKLLSSKGLKPPSNTKTSALAPLRGPASSKDAARHKAAVQAADIEKAAHTALISCKRALSEQVELALDGDKAWRGTDQLVSFMLKTMK